MSKPTGKGEIAIKIFFASNDLINKYLSICLSEKPILEILADNSY